MDIEVVGMRARSATRTIIRWMVLLLLLQYLGGHPSFTAAGEGEHVTAKIVKYLNYPHSVFTSNYGGRVDFTNSARACRLGGGLLSADHTPAAHRSIADHLREAAVPNHDLVLTYMDGDAQYTASWERNPVKRCVRGTTGASLNCIFQWNMGVFADAAIDGIGVSFFKGTLYSLTGAGPMNGYKPYWPPRYPAHGETFLISRLLLKSAKAEATWYDWTGVPVAHDGSGRSVFNSDLPPESFGVVCEIQDGFTINTTPPPAVVPSWTQKHWYVILILIFLPLLAVLALLVFCCCCRGAADESKWVVPMVLREVNGEPLYAIGSREEIDWASNDGDHMQSSILGDA